jgi:hypothetical protein
MRTAAAIAVVVMLVVFAARSGAAQVISADTEWSDVVMVEGTVEVAEGATLTIKPGTRVLFAKGVQDDEGLAGTGMLVLGSVIALGEPGRHIRFSSIEDEPAPGDWGEVRILKSPDSRFVYCDFSYGGWGLHVHDSKVLVKDCSFEHNSYGGVRGKGGDVEVEGSFFTGMDIGIRYWQGKPHIRGNTITGNTTGIFFRQDCTGAKAEYNNIYGNREYDLKLGDGHDTDVDAANNWWGTADIARIRQKIYDKGREEYIGAAVIEPVLQGKVADQ